jgi:hypothetical protein
MATRRKRSEDWKLDDPVCQSNPGCSRNTAPQELLQRCRYQTTPASAARNVLYAAPEIRFIAQLSLIGSHLARSRRLLPLALRHRLR